MIIFTFIRIFLLIFFSLHLLSCAGDRRMSLISSISPFVERNNIIYTYTLSNFPNSLVLPDCPSVSDSDSVKRFDCTPIDTKGGDTGSHSKPNPLVVPVPQPDCSLVPDPYNRFPCIVVQVKIIIIKTPK
jgi:hypothetical protein